MDYYSKHGELCRNHLIFAPVSLWLNGDAHRVLNCTAAQTAPTRHCHSGPGGAGALAPLSRLQGNCFSAPRLFMFCDWIIQPGAREATFVARLGCFSALPLSWLFQRSLCTRWHEAMTPGVFCILPTHCKENGLLFIKTHFPSETPFPSLFISTYKDY